MTAMICSPPSVAAAGELLGSPDYSWTLCYAMPRDIRCLGLRQIPTRATNGSGNGGGVIP
jgi:hypothetical protein